MLLLWYGKLSRVASQSIENRSEKLLSQISYTNNSVQTLSEGTWSLYKYIFTSLKLLI